MKESRRILNLRSFKGCSEHLLKFFLQLYEHLCGFVTMVILESTILPSINGRYVVVRIVTSILILECALFCFAEIDWVVVSGMVYRCRIYR